MPKITAAISHALKTRTLDRVFICPVNPDLKPIIYFASDEKMDDEDYRKLIEELISCRHSTDKIALIKEKVKSFDDLDDILLDAQLHEEEIISMLDILEDVEVAEIIRRHPFRSDVQAVDLSETEQVLRLCLENYINGFAVKRKEQIFKLVSHLNDDRDMRE